MTFLSFAKLSISNNGLDVDKVKSNLNKRVRSRDRCQILPGKRFLEDFYQKLMCASTRHVPRIVLQTVKRYSHRFSGAAGRDGSSGRMAQGGKQFLGSGMPTLRSNHKNPSMRGGRRRRLVKSLFLVKNTTMLFRFNRWKLLYENKMKRNV